MVLTKTALVTGATGFIGREVVVALANAGWQVILGIRAFDVPSAFREVRVDLSDPATILDLAKEVRCDVIVHLGARVGLSGETEADLFEVNVLSTGCVAYLAKLWEARLVYASTTIVHGVRSESISINSPFQLDTAYAKSKWLGERLIEASNVRHCILRIAGVFGRSGPAHLGLNRAIDGAIKGELPLQIGTGAALRNYVYVKDVARAIVYTLQEDLGGVHLLAGDEVMSIGEMLQQVCDTFMPGRHPLIDGEAQSMSQVVIPSTELPITRGFHEALVDIREGCRQ